MQLNGFARMAVGLAFIALLFLGGCRATTDRMRFIEAENADAARRNAALMDELATLRAKSVQDQAELERQRARADAAEKRIGALEYQRAHDGTIRVDPNRFRTPGVDVISNDDGGATIILASDVTFKPGRADLSKKAITILQKVAAALKSTEAVRAVRVEGHTDSDPIRRSGWKDNDALSLARAKMVRKYLVGQGVAKDFVSVEGLGASKPVQSNKTQTGKAKNRRVEIILLAR